MTDQSSAMMHETLSAQVAQMREALLESHQQIVAAHEKLRALTVQVHSQDRTMSLGLDAAGQVTSLEFADDSYVDLAPEELSAEIVRLFRAAQAELRRAVLETAPPSPLGGLTLEQALDPGSDVAALLPEDLFGSLFDGAGRTGRPRG